MHRKPVLPVLESHSDFVRTGGDRSSSCAGDLYIEVPVKNVVDRTTSASNQEGTAHECGDVCNIRQDKKKRPRRFSRGMSGRGEAEPPQCRQEAEVRANGAVCTGKFQVRLRPHRKRM